MNFIDKILLEATYETLLKRYVTNPETGHAIKISSALSYDDSHPVKKKAQEILARATAEDAPKRTFTKKTAKKHKEKKVKKEPNTEKNTDAPRIKREKSPEETETIVKPKDENSKSHKPKSKSYGISKECVDWLKEKGLTKLNALPQAFVSTDQIQLNPKLTETNRDTMWVCKFPIKLPNGKDAFKSAYTAGFMKKAQVKKYKKISKIKEADITALDTKTKQLLSNSNPVVADSACVLSIILKTGLRVGSLDETDSGNIGVRTLKAENIKVEGDKVSLNFIGKSYQENTAEIEDAELAAYLTKKLQSKQEKDSVFQCSYPELSAIMKKINPKAINPKDLRTYKATQLAKELLGSKEFAAPPPLTDDPKQLKKQVKEKLKMVFERVAKILNNNPGMAKNSYVHPVVITDFLERMGLTPKEAAYKHVTLEAVERKSSAAYDHQQTSMDQMFEKYQNFGQNVDTNDISDEDSDNCEEFLVPRWVWDENWDLVKK